MHIGLSRPRAPAYPIPDVDAAFVAREAEAAGFESILYGEHPITPLDEGLAHSVHTYGVPHFQETVVALSRVSAATSKIRFGFGICILPEHHPVRLAKQLGCLDYYSGGRLMIGIGTGWSPQEYQAIGGRFDRRWAQCKESVGLMRDLWTKDRVEHHGEFWDIPAVRCFPQPAQKNGPPVLIGSKGEKAFQRLVDYGDGWMPSFVTPEAIEEGPEFVVASRARILEIAEQAGKPAFAFSTTAILRGDVTRGLLARYAAAGVERVNITLPYYETEDGARKEVATLAEALL